MSARQRSFSRTAGLLDFIVQDGGRGAIACVLGLCHVGSRLAADDNIVRSSFMLLGALTVPHMALHWLEHRVDKEVPTHG